MGCLLVTTPTMMIPAQAATIQETSKEALPEQIITTLEILKRDSQGKLNLSNKVTRAQFSQMIVNASQYKDKVGTNTSTSLYKDVKKTYWAAPYIKIAVNNGWMTGNIYGQFRPTSYITLQEAVNAVVALLGYENSDFQGNKSTAKMNLYTSKDLDTNINKSKGQILTRKDCMNLFYNVLVAETKAKEIYAKTLGYEIDSNGDVNYLALVNDKMKGPIIGMPGWAKKIPFAISSGTFYRNGTKSSASAMKKYDVLYYSKSLRTVWAYSNKVTGRYEAALPSKLSPEQITIAGRTYDIGSQDVSYSLSTMGQYDIGDNISILLGKDDTVVGVVKAGNVNTTVGGVVISVEKRTNSDDDKEESLVSYIKVVDSSGIEHEYECDTEKLSKGDAVQISYVSGKIVVNKLTMSSISGRVNSTGNKIDTYKFAEDIRILDMKYELYTVIPKSRIANVYLNIAAIKYYKLNSDNEITDLILWDVTGDIYKYGILLNGLEVGQTGTYEVDIDGTKRTEVTARYALGSTGQGPAAFEYTNNQLTAIRMLSGTDVSAVTGLTIMSGQQTYTLSDKLVVYLVEDGKYYKTTLSKVSNLNNYKLKAYYDRNENYGGRIRIIEARAKK